MGGTAQQSKLNMTGIRAYIGTKKYYKRIFVIMLPILAQNMITNFVSLLDNIMVGQVGTEPMSGVAISNQLIFVFNLCIFGGLSGAGIFTAQFVGKGDNDGVRNTVRMKLYIAVFSSLVFAAIYWLAGAELIRLFLHEGNEGLDLQLTFGFGMEYLHVMMLQMLPFAVMQMYSTTLREAGQTVVPMRASKIAVAVNLVGNYILIFGKFGAPQMGTTGAAVATVISRFVELLILVIYSHRHTRKYPFFKGLYKSLRIGKAMAFTMIRKGFPLMLNEILWAAGMATLNQCYSVRGLEVVSATNISSTIGNLFFCFTMALGATITIMIGHHLGAGKLEEAAADFKKIMLLGVLMCVGIGIIMIIFAPLMAGVYNTSDTVKAMAARFLMVIGFCMPMEAYVNACYFTLRSGGRTVITFIFDSAFTWACQITLAFALTHFTDLPILTIYILVNAMTFIKCLIGFFMVRSGVWIVNLVAGED